MDAQLETNLVRCLDALEQRQPLEAILAQYPHDRIELAPYLHVAAALQSLAAASTIRGEDASRRAMITYARSAKSPTRSQFYFPRMARAFAILLLVAGLAGLMVRQAQAALPGSALYGVKRTLEGVELFLAPSPSAKAELLRNFEQERQSEVKTLLAGLNESDAEFSGVIESIVPDQWIVSGIVVYVTQGSIIEGVPTPGATVHIAGRTIQGSFIAYRLVVAGSADPSAAPTATPTPSDSSSHIAVPTQTRQPTSVPDEDAPEDPSNHPSFEPSATSAGLIDDDQDGVDDAEDNCVGLYNPDQESDACEDEQENSGGEDGGSGSSGSSDSGSGSSGGHGDP